MTNLFKGAFLSILSSWQHILECNIEERPKGGKKKKASVQKGESFLVSNISFSFFVLWLIFGRTL